MERKFRKTLIGAAAFALGFGLAASAYGAVSGACSDCHTMHASQDGVASTPNNQLLTVAGCGGCHAQGIANAGSLDALSTYPQVTADTTGWAASKETELAGGFFDTTTGASASAMHNPSDISAQIPTDTLTAPPGFNAGGIWPGSGTLSCSGTNGCHDTGGHHLNATGDNETTGATVATSYRFLKLAVRGYEDGDYEFSSTTADHNQYYGVAQTKGTAGTTTGTMSNFCAGCHDNFHTMTEITGDSTGGTGTWWLRHPVDFDLTDATGSTEYANYTTYDLTVPVASDVVSQPDTTIQDSLVGATTANDAVVMCLSCHRAHGSRHADLLRWDYTAIEAGVSGTAGCLVCHNTK